MGEIIVDVELENLEDSLLFRDGHIAESDVRRVKANAVVDTSVMFLMLPQDVVERPGVREMRTSAFVYDGGRRRELPAAGPLIVRIGDRWMTTECAILPKGAGALVGQIVVGGLDMVADCASGTLAPRTPDGPTLRL